MNNLRYRLSQLMIGRRGFDQFCRGISYLALLFIVINIFLRSNILSMIALALLIYAYYRAFSRNLSRRAAENQWYVTYVYSPFHGYIARDRKNFRYFKCPTCGQVLRAPKGRGKIRVTCSRCHNVFEKKV